MGQQQQTSAYMSVTASEHLPQHTQQQNLEKRCDKFIIYSKLTIMPSRWIAFLNNDNWQTD
jgi:hypothetical protein